MQYNSQADNQDIVSLVGDLTNTDTTQYPLKAITRAANKWNKTVWTWIFQAYGGWQYDDGNQTDLPSGTDTLTSGKTAYALPTGSYTVRGIDIKNSGGVWSKLEPITEEQIRDIQAESEFYKTASTPRFYQLVGQTVKIYPAANWTQAASFKVYFDRGSVSFVSTDTTATPGFVAEFHEVIAYGPAFEFAKRKGLPNKNDLLADLQDYERRIKDFYMSKFHEMFPSRVTVRDAVREAQ